jgi:hypothetical protein
MTIRARIEDATILYKIGRCESALLCALILMNGFHFHYRTP